MRVIEMPCPLLRHLAVRRVGAECPKWLQDSEGDFQARG